jgi:hypothetical protein
VGGLPAGAALAADVLGFLDRAEQPGGAPVLARSGPWWRISTPVGHVLARARGGLLR